MDNPYHITGPALLSVSGGRTSGFMLRQILDAHGGALPADVVPIFCNTGLEHAATYNFLIEIGRRWAPIVWLEYHRGSAGHGFKVVDACSANRAGDPFAELIGAKGVLPNPHTRLCSSELKIRTGNRYARSLGWDGWTRAVGLRHDEPHRVARLKGDTSAEDVVCPMHAAGHGLSDVTEFWREQAFDLRLPNNDPAFGNCKLCFLKKPERLARVMQSDPSAADWWIAQEERTDIRATGDGHLFRNDRASYRAQLWSVMHQGRLLDDTISDDTGSLPCYCTD